MGSMGIQKKIAWFSIERSRTLSRMVRWLGSLPKNRFGKQIRKDPCHCKEIEKALELWNQDTENRLQERVSTGIEKKSRGTLERHRDLSKIRK
jgi:hypothetical protein